MYQFTSFVFVLRELMRPGVFWFLRNPHDPNFNPLREMIEFPMTRHFRRFFFSALMYGIVAFTIAGLPTIFCKHFLHFVLPLNIFHSDLFEAPSDLLLFHLVVPYVLDRFKPVEIGKVFFFYFFLIFFCRNYCKCG
jgi:E3 ubiquitin-protein ligase MARCH6